MSGLSGWIFISDVGNGNVNGMDASYDKISMFALWLTWCWKPTPQRSILAHMPSHHPSPDLLLLLNTYDRIISHHDDQLTFVFWSWLSWWLYAYLGHMINIKHYPSPDMLLHNIQNGLSRVSRSINIKMFFILSSIWNCYYLTPRIIHHHFPSHCDLNHNCHTRSL